MITYITTIRGVDYMKKEFRKKVINLRKEKDKDFIKHNSDIITDKLLNLDCIKNAKNIMLYILIMKYLQIV